MILGIAFIGQIKMELQTKTTDKILIALKNAGFEVLSFGTSFVNPFEVIDEEYFNEKVNEALKDY